MSEWIKKDAVLSTIEAMFERCTTYDIIDYKELMLEAVKVLPSADRPQAEWAEDEEGYWRCTNCGRKAEWEFFEDDYCPRCGARMKGADNETIRTEDI